MTLVLVVGTGYSGLMKIHTQTEQYLRSPGIELIGAKTEKARKTYNELFRSRRVAAALRLTCQHCRSLHTDRFQFA